jgi:hypothetical protein
MNLSADEKLLSTPAKPIGKNTIRNNGTGTPEMEETGLRADPGHPQLQPGFVRKYSDFATGSAISELLNISAMYTTGERLKLQGTLHCYVANSYQGPKFPHWGAVVQY